MAADQARQRKPYNSPRRSLERELPRAPKPLLSEVRSQFVLRKDTVHRLSDRLGDFRVEEDRRPANHLGDRGAIGRGDGSPAGHRFQGRQAETFF